MEAGPPPSYMETLSVFNPPVSHSSLFPSHFSHGVRPEIVHPPVHLGMHTVADKDTDYKKAEESKSTFRRLLFVGLVLVFGITIFVVTIIAQSSEHKRYILEMNHGSQ